MEDQVEDFLKQLAAKLELVLLNSESIFTQKPVTAYGQRQSPTCSKNTITDNHGNPEAGRNRENSPGYGQRSLCENWRWP